MEPAQLLPLLLGIAVLLPLLSFFLILCFGTRMGKAGQFAAYLAVSAIGLSCLLSFVSLAMWIPVHGTVGNAYGPPPHYTGSYYLLGQFGDLRAEISYYIDSLTLAMFCMVTLIATLIHFYSIGYMHDEQHDVTDHEVFVSHGKHLHRPGRYHRFFQYLSLFCFSMLGLVLAGNLLMVFVFWELVGVCSYFLIGFYVERKHASTAANKAFIVNRVGDFGMLIGMMILWAGIGTFAFGDIDYDGDGTIGPHERGLFSLVRPAEAEHEFTVPDGMVLMAARAEAERYVAEYRQENPDADRDEIDQAVAAMVPVWREGEPDEPGYGYWWMVLAGIGIFFGCVGKSAQFPLHTWLPDAMEGPTPVSALVHSATMVAAGVYLVGRFFPVFAPETLLVIAAVGCITLLIGASIALVATDIKRVLAYSTISQLGYMMLGLGVGGWLAGMMHLITHAFFKSLLFMCSGSVIHAVHTNEMTEMGGLRRKMPITAYTMLIGCLAIAGISVPFVVGFSGYYSKDAILEQAFAFMGANPAAGASIFFIAAMGGAGLTAFYMFRMWFMTFAGKPRNVDRYQHAHESPPVMYVPLIILAVFAVVVAWSTFSQLFVGAFIALLVGILIVVATRPRAPETLEPQTHDAADHHAPAPMLRYLLAGLALLVLVGGSIWLITPLQNVVLVNLLEQSRPAGTARDVAGLALAWTWPDEHFAHAPEQFWTIVVPVTLLAFVTAIGGIALAAVMYGFGYLSPADVRRQFGAVYTFLLHKWWFDELYDRIFVRPTHAISRWATAVDNRWLDWLIDGSAKVTYSFAVLWERVTDQLMVDGAVDRFADWTWNTGMALHRLQTGKLRQYVVFIVVGAVALFVLISFFWAPAPPG